MTKRKTKRRQPFILRFALTIFGIALAVMSLAITAEMVYALPNYVGIGSKTSPTAVADSDLMGKFHMFLNNGISDALDGTISIPKQYWISEGTVVPPKPAQSCYGETNDPAELQAVIDAAADLLEGQSLYFSPDVKLLDGSKVRYYRDDSILVFTWKVVQDYMVYTFSEVKIAHPSQFRRFLAGGEYGSDKLFVTTEMAESVNAVVATSGDFYRFRNAGIVVYEGQVRRVNPNTADTCFISRSGDLSFKRANEYMTPEEAQKFVDDNDISYSLVFGPVLVKDKEIVKTNHYMLGEIDEEYARSALCQMGPLHYLVATANSESQWKYVPTIYQFAKRIQETGCLQAYALDGGQTAAIVMNNELINNVVYGYQRKISDIVYFATAVPYGG